MLLPELKKKILVYSSNNQYCMQGIQFFSSFPLAEISYSKPSPLANHPWGRVSECYSSARNLTFSMEARPVKHKRHPPFSIKSIHLPGSFLILLVEEKEDYLSNANSVLSKTV